MDFPNYCQDINEAERCADHIAENHGLLEKEIFEKDPFSSTIIYGNEEIRMVIKIFKDNWHGRQSCYSFKLLSLERLDGTAREGMPFERMIRGYLQRQEWRKKPSYFASDISKAVGALRSADKSGRVKGTIIELRGGYGFARTAYIPRVFVLLKYIHEDIRDFVKIGTELTFNVKTNPKGPRAADIEVVGQKEFFEAIALAEQAEDDIELMNVYKDKQHVTELIEYQVKRSKDDKNRETNMAAALRKALSEDDKD